MTILKSSVISSIREVILEINRSTFSPPVELSVVPDPIVFNNVVIANVDTERFESLIKLSNSKLTTNTFSGCLMEILLINLIAANLVAVLGTPNNFCKVVTICIYWSSFNKCCKFIKALLASNSTISDLCFKKPAKTGYNWENNASSSTRILLIYLINWITDNEFFKDDPSDKVVTNFINAILSWLLNW